MKVVGVIFIIFGLIDAGGSWLGFDLWYSIIGFDLPGILWYASGFIELGIGYFLLNLGNESDE